MWPCYYYIVALVGGYDVVEVYGNNSVSEYAAYHVVWVSFNSYIAYRVLPLQMNCTGFLRLKTYPCEFAIDNGKHLYANLLSVWSIHSLLLDALATVIRVAL